MEYKVLEKQDAWLMKDFIDDVGTKYDTDLLNAFLEEKNAYAYVAKEGGVIVGFALLVFLLNGYSSMLQRYNRLRISKIMKKCS